MPRKNKTFYDGKFGYAFKNGKFYRFEKRQVMVIKAWPDPRAWLKRPSHGWIHTRKFPDEWFSLCLSPEYPDPQPVLDGEPMDPRQLLLPFPEGFPLTRAEAARKRDMLAQNSFMDAIPSEVRHALMPFSDRKWHLLNLVARCPGSLDLVQSNPALAYALASNWVFRRPAVQQPIRAARSLVRQKQKHILKWLGFPPLESVRRIMAKIVPKSISIERLLYLRTALENAAIRKALSHLNRINACALRLATDPRYFPYVTPRLLDEISRDSTFDEYNLAPVDHLRDTLELAKEDDRGYCPRQFSSYARLVEVHDLLDRRLRVQLGDRYRTNQPLAFPDPPFMGTKWIQPILTAEDLLKEGNEMDHCAGMYADEVASGGTFIYRVLDPVRATLSLRQYENEWKPDQLYKHHNAPVDQSLRKDLFHELLSSGPYEPGDVWDKNQLALPIPMQVMA